MIEYTRSLLTVWGRWVRGRVDLGYPHSAAFIHADQGGRAFDINTPMPEDIETVDQIVCRAPAHYKAPLFIAYLNPCSEREQARRAAMSRRRFRRALAQAQLYVDRRLTILDH